MLKLAELEHEILRVKEKKKKYLYDCESLYIFMPPYPSVPCSHALMRARREREREGGKENREKGKQPRRGKII